MKLKIIPLLQVIIYACMGSLIQTTLTYPATTFTIPVIVIATISITGTGIVLLGGLVFRLTNTSISPLNPHKANQLITRGIYHYSRNPMYVGFLLILFAWCLYLGNLITMLIPVLFVWSMTYLQIIPEEKALETLFGNEYKQYCQTVRRWV